MLERDMQAGGRNLIGVDVLRYRGIVLRCSDDAYERLVRFLTQCPDYAALSRISNCRPIILKIEGTRSPEEREKGEGRDGEADEE